MPSTLSILVTVFDDAELPKAIAAWSAVAMVGLVGGPVVGGALLAHFWWVVFLLNIPIAGLAIVAALVLMPSPKGPAQGRPDRHGAVDGRHDRAHLDDHRASQGGLAASIHSSRSASPCSGWSGSGCGRAAAPRR